MLFKDRLAEIVASTELENDDWFEEAFSLYLLKNSNKTKGVKKYTRDIQIIEDITIKINDTFRNHIKKVLQDEEDYITTLENVQSKLATATENYQNLQTQFNALDGKYKDLKTQDSRGQELIDQLRKTIEEKDKQIDQNGKLLQKFEKLELEIKTFKTDDPEASTNQNNDRKAEREAKKLEKANKIKNQKPPIPAGNFEIKTVTETTELLKQQYNVTEEEEKEGRNNYGTTLSAAEFNIKSIQNNNVQGK